MINSSPTCFNFIGEGSSFCGDLYIKGHAHIFGSFTGTITGDDDSVLTIEYTGKVKGTITGASVHIHGQILGDLKKTSSIEAYSTARIKGNIETKSVKIFPGAKIDGQILTKEISSKI